ncbi:putative reverse transcriptase domain, reverse transcriptase zinc-binding domain protein [Tanacetum coccineum]
MVGWIMECVTSTSFSLGINGSLHGYFKGKRGLRQGDPMSPYLFTLVMEVLTLMLHRRVRVLDDFTYHRYSSKLNIINLCFANDLFLFAHGDVDSAWAIMDTLEELKNASGLTPSLPKSTAYFCNVLNYVKLDIFNVLQFKEGKLLVKYLGVPLVPSRLMLELEQLMRGFLWCQGEMKKGKAKVAWEVVCFPKREGGLGIRCLEFFNKALITSYIWSLLSHKESLWVIWIHTYKLNGRTLWEIPLHGKIWPIEWNSKYPSLYNIDVPNFSSASDKLVWKNSDNVESGFFVATVCSCIRPRVDEVNWHHVIWFSHQIPRHAIHLWLVIKRKLKTQDTLRQGDVSINTNLNLLQCPLCETQPDSHDHLFFECVFSLEV